MHGRALVQHRKRVVVVSDRRVPTGVQGLDLPGVRMHVKVARDLTQLDRLASKRSTGLIVLDAAIPARAGGFDASDAAQWLLTREISRPVLVWMDGTLSSGHMAETVGLAYRKQRGLVGGAVCDRSDCLTRAAATTLLTRTWTDDHLDRDAIGFRRVTHLYTELEKRTAVSDLLLGLAVRPMASYKEMAALFHRSQKALRTALGEQARPALTRLGWLSEADRLDKGSLIALVHQRFPYFTHYIHRRRPQLVPLLPA